jgi:hypothetical protein
LPSPSAFALAVAITVIPVASTTAIAVATAFTIAVAVAIVIAIAIGAAMISKLILGYLFSTTALALTGMECQSRDLATCALVLSSLVNARNDSFD